MRWALLAAVGLAAVGCGGDGVLETAQVRVVHTAPLAGPVDVLLNGDTAATSLAVNQTTGYVGATLFGQSITLAVSPAGTGTDLLFEDHNLSSGTFSTIFLTGTGTSTVQSATFSDNRTAPTSGTARIRFVHVATGDAAQAYDVYVTAGSADPTTGTVVGPTVAFESASTFSVSAGTHQIVVTKSGTTTVVATSGSISFASGQARTFFAANSSGSASAVSSSLFVLNDLN